MFFPKQCEPYMKNCARVSFDMCREKKIYEDCAIGDCAQMSEEFTDPAKFMEVSQFFDNTVAEVND